MKKPNKIKKKSVGKGKFCEECANYTMRYVEDIDSTQSVYQCTKCNNSKAL